MIIYKITNTINGKIYIGKTTKSLNERKKTHLKRFRYGKKTHLYSAFKKYGNDAFLWEELIKCSDINELNELEIFFIKKYDSIKNGYNMTMGGDGGDTISMKSAEEKKNQGAKIGHIPWNKGISMKNLGYTFENNKPRPKFTDEQKLEHSIKIKGSSKYYNGLKNRHHGMSKKVLRVSDGKIWETIKECSQEIGVRKATVRRYIYKSKPINNEQFIFLN
jgi:group I intron endonuclease